MSTSKIRQHQRPPLTGATNLHGIPYHRHGENNRTASAATKNREGKALIDRELVIENCHSVPLRPMRAPRCWRNTFVDMCLDCPMLLHGVTWTNTDIQIHNPLLPQTNSNSLRQTTPHCSNTCDRPIDRLAIASIYMPNMPVPHAHTEFEAVPRAIHKFHTKN